MVVLTGKNLGERQRELNSKVAEVVANKTDFDVIKAEDEITDVDKLYKIDIASKYKDIDYIIDILKSGDSLYISRALKCVWMYEDSYSHVINVENLHDNIFPYMSLKMKAKLLSSISMHVRQEDRAAGFYTYCIKNKMPGIAKKFLNFTSEEFKIDAIKNKQVGFLQSSVDTHKVLENFVGNSFTLATACIEANNFKKGVVYNLRFLYTVSSEKYLDILEEYEYVSLKNPNSLTRFGIRMSKDIMIKHKNRVLKNPLLYVNKLNKNMLVKYSTNDDAKLYIANLMPHDVTEFWNINFCKAYDYILDLIPMNEKFEYMKQLFNTEYPDEDFEMTLTFYNLKYYEMLPIDERELWALRHIDSQKEILGSGKDYIWYKFVNLNKALVEMKKYIMITPDGDKRSKMLNILVESARDQNDLMQLLDYYYDRHVNEKEHDKETFINKVLSVHNVFEFQIECWEALNKLFYSLEIYTVGFVNFRFKVFQAVAVACHILHNKEMPQALLDFVDLDINYSYFTLLLEKMGKNNSEIVYQHILQMFLEKLEPFEQDPNNKKLRDNLVKYVYNINNLLSSFRKDDKECPKIVKTFLEIHSPNAYEEKRITVGDLQRLLKKDAKLSVEVLSDLEENINNWPKRFNNVLRKLKVYFSNDVAKEYIQFFNSCLSKLSDKYNEFNCIRTAVYGIFVLADESSKVDFMEKYQPLAPKINHQAIDRKIQFIQEAICRLVGYSRPPVPLQNVLKYIKGDYVQYCLPLFNMYLVNLPLPQAVAFTEAILNAPLSVQKHGLRIAFKCYAMKNLKDLLINVWKKTKNVSMRLVLYKSLFNKILCENEDNQAELYEVLKFFTSDLHMDDHEDLFDLICSYKLPDRFKDDYLQTAWDMIINLPEKPVNIQRQIGIIETIENRITLVQRQFIYKRIIEEFISGDLKISHSNMSDDTERLNDAKWELTAKFILSYSNRKELEESLRLVNTIFKKCLVTWNELHDEKEYIYRTFYFNFVKTVKDKSVLFKINKSIPVYQQILDMLRIKCKHTDVYLLAWDLQVAIYAIKIITEYGDKGDDSEEMRFSTEEISVKFAKEIDSFIKLLSDDHQFYTVFLREIADILKENILDMVQILKLKTHSEMNFYESLVDLDMKETHLLTLAILPMDVQPEMKDVHTRIIKKIQSFNENEVKSFLNSKFVIVKSLRDEYETDVPVDYYN